MNLWFRLLAYIFVRNRAHLRIRDGISVVRSRVWPNDLDLSGHMNNGRYLTLMDFGRLDYMVRTGLLKVVMRNKWVPVATTITARFVREMRLWARFRIETRAVGLHDAQVFFEHRVVFESGPRKGDLAALALVKAGIYDRKAKRLIPVAELAGLIGETIEDQPLRDDLANLIVLEKQINAISIATTNNEPSGQHPSGPSHKE